MRRVVPSVLWAILCVGGIAPAFGQLPIPPGPNCVGQMKTHVVDSSRAEIFTATPDDFRTLVLGLWYPGTCEGERAVYGHPDVLLAYTARMGRTDSVDIGSIAQAQTHSYKNSAFASKVHRAPILMFSHGAGTPIEFYTSIYEHLASHGYVVAVVAHTFEVAAVEFPSGDIVFRDEELLNRPFTEEVTSAWNAMMAFVQTEASSADKLARVHQLFNGDFPGTVNVKRRATDVAFALGEVIAMNSDATSPLYQRLNVEQVGGFGHSFGGAVMGQLILSESRVKAAINLDGWQFGEMAGRALHTPFLYVRGGYPQLDALNTVMYADAGSQFTQVKMEGTLHENFSDLPLFVGSNENFQTGELDAVRNALILNTLIQAFFDYHLRDQQEAWRTLQETYPELVFERGKPK